MMIIILECICGQSTAFDKLDLERNPAGRQQCKGWKEGKGECGLEYGNIEMLEGADNKGIYYAKPKQIRASL